jgi:uncharacterized protein
VLFVDEAGQVALADALAVAQAARSVVLLGDPPAARARLPGHPSARRGASVLEHVLGPSATIPPDRGVFLGTSWRMHPDVCGLRVAHDVRRPPGLRSRRRAAAHRLARAVGQRPAAPPVPHEDNRGRSAEEAEAVAAEVERLLDGGTWVDRDGRRHPLTLDDILVVAPYNAQVRCLSARLPDGARIGTVGPVPGPGGAGRPVLHGQLERGRRRPRDAVPVQPQPSSTSPSRGAGASRWWSAPRAAVGPLRHGEDMRLVNMLCRFAEEAR